MKTQDELDQIFLEIKRGYSTLKIKNKNAYVKHLSVDEVGSLSAEKNKHQAYAQKKGLQTKEEIEKTLEDQGVWTEKDKKDLEQKKIELKNLKKTRNNLFLEQDLKIIDDKINEVGEFCKQKDLEVQSFFQNTAEDYADKKTNESLLRNSIFSDKNLSKLFYDEKSFDYLSRQELLQLFTIYNLVNSKFSNESLKDLAISSTVKNILNLYGDDYSNFFYGKPIDWTFYQVNLINYAKMFKNIFEHYEVPENISNDAEKIINFVEETRNKKEKAKNLLEKSDKSDGFSFARAKRKDLEKMGINTKNKKDIHSIAKDQGKDELSMEDLLKIHNK